ncbi:NUDIX hydrolase [Pradoshia sp.]
METEVLKIFDEQGARIGSVTRKEAHEKGLWHETFHVYFTDGNDIYLQKRSSVKKGFPRLFDITAAGHLLVQETVQDGVREIEEELGITVKFEELAYLGEIRNIIQTDEMIDKEFSHVFLYECEKPMESFVLQPEEVEGMVRVRIDDFIGFYAGKCNQLTAEGFMVEKDGKKTSYIRVLSKDDFVPHAEEYFLAVAKAIGHHLSEEG